MLLRCLIPLVILSGLAMSIQGCYRLSNQAESLALDCGVAKEEVQKGKYLRISDFDVQTETRLSASNLRVVFRDDDRKISYNLPVTSKGCVKLPSVSGQVLISSKDSRSSAFYEHRASLWSFTQPEVTLTPSPEVKASLQCDPQGIFANARFFQPFKIEFAGSLAPVRITISALNQKTRLETDLFVKNWGATQLSLPLQLDASSLDEGTYKIRAHMEDPADGFDAGPRPLVPNESCDLIIIRASPLLSSAFPVDEKLRVPVFKPGDQLPWQPANVSDSLFVCKEKSSSRGKRQDPGQCIPRGECADRSMFTKVRSVVVNEPGLFDYFVYTQDNAENVSPLQCQTLAVSTEAPRIELQWKRSQWNTDGGEVMDLPYANLEAQVQLNHPLLSQDELKERIQCKVEFLLQGNDALKGDRVICTSGRCQGQSMGDFVPCDTSLSFSIQKAWEQKNIQMSQIKLTAKVDDGASHSETASARVWLNSSRWSLKPVKDAPQVYQPWSVLTDSQKNFLFLHQQNNVYRVQDDQWTLTTSEDAERAHILEFVQNRDGKILGLGNAETASGNGSRIYEWNGRSWDRVQSTECSALYKSSVSEILCGVEDAPGSGVTTLAKRRDKIWSFIPLKDVSDVGRNFQVYEDSKGDLWIYGNSKAYRLQMGSSSWEKLIIKDDSRLLEDRDGIVWMVSNGQIRETTFAQRLDGKSFVEVTLPPVTQELRDQFHLSPAGVLTFGRFVWSPKINGWEALPYPSDIVEAPQTYYPLYDNLGQVWWFDNYGITGPLNGSRVRIPLNIYGLSCYDESTPCSVSITGEKTLTLGALRVSDASYGAYVFQVNSLSAFSLEDMGLPSTKDFYSVWSSSGIPMELNFSYYKGPLFGLRDGVWKPTTKVELPVASLGYRAPDGSVFFVSGSKIFVSREDGPWEPVVYPEGQTSAPGGDFQTWRDLAFYTRKGGGHALIARDGTIFSVPYSGQLLFPLDDDLWGTDGQGFVGYKDLSFSQKYRIDFSDFDMKFEDVFSAAPLKNDWIYAIVRIQDAYQKTILNVKSGKVLPLTVPLEEVTEISKVIPFDGNSSLVLTIRGIFQVDHRTGKWTLLPFSKALMNEWGMISISNMYLDERKRLWMHGGGMFMRFDFGRAEIAFP